MKSRLKKRLVFTVAGVIAGFLYYRPAGCAPGACPITANPFRSMIYMGAVGWLVSLIIGEEGKCSM